MCFLLYDAASHYDILSWNPPSSKKRGEGERLLFSVYDECALRRARRYAGALSETAMWRTDGVLTNTSSLRRETSDWA